jgi:hypothetical protein
MVSALRNKTLRYYFFLSCFTGGYLYSIYRAHKSDNEVLRIGAAGSITTLIGESSFYFIDAINARSKVLPHNVGFKEMFNDVIKTEGVAGLFKGYSACYYSSILYGYLYFYIYKGFKYHVKETEAFKARQHSTSVKALVYASASTVAEIVSLFIYYPFELTKIRLLTKNDIYGYTSVSDAFVKILKADGVTGLYRGLVTFFFAFMGQYTLQMTTYELIMDKTLRDLGSMEKLRENENFYVLKASVISGVIAALLTNSLEVMVLRKQTQKEITIREILK